MAPEQFQQQQAQTTTAEVDLHHSHEALQGAQAALEGKQAALRQAQVAVQASEQTVAVQRLEVQQAEAGTAVQQTLSDFTTVRARTTGIVTQRLVDPGVLVQPGTALFKVAALDHVRLQAAVAESDIDTIRRGTLVRVTGPTLPRPVEARITSVFHSADPKSHTGTVEALVPNPGGHLVGGSYIVMRLQLQRADHVLTVPRAAIVRDQRASVWKVIDRAGQTVAVRVPVETGIDDGQRVAIVKGLSAGDRVVWAGAEGLQEGAAVTPARWGTGPYRDMLETAP
jgi:RND family efflux transporter MFP subunit